MSENVVELCGVTKRFPGVVALRDMSIQIRPGEIHGLIGENGAGKSTLIKILTGVYQPDEGEIYVEDTKYQFKEPNQAKNVGLACVYQELNIVREVSITDNIFLGRALKKKNGLLDYGRMDRIAQEVMFSLGQDVNPREECSLLGMGVQQMVEIAKAVLVDAKLIIMDEPTSSLGESEVAQLMETVRSLKERGVAILYVSHKLEELFEICDRVTVMRDGEHIITKDIYDLDNDSLIQAMVGRSLDNRYPKMETIRGKEALRVENVITEGVLKDVSFTAYYGEIVGFSGLVGAGRTETMRAIFGADPFDSGKVYISEQMVKIKKPDDAIRHGIAFLTEDRKGQGLILAEPIKTNLILANMGGFKKGFLLDEKRIEDVSKENIKKLRIKTPSINEVTSQLSGGNQQKVVIGKWLNTDAKIFIFDEPTRGIDVGAKIEVYNIMNELASQGKCVIMISSELPEVLGLCDRIIIMRSGQIMGEIDKRSPEGAELFNQETIMKAAWGGEIYEHEEKKY